MIKTVLVLLACSMLSVAAMCQNSTDTEDAENFNQYRMTDFKKLIGGLQEGVRVNYNTEKAIIEGSMATHIKKQKVPTKSLLQFTGSVGTTTNLSKLFGSDLLPTYSTALTLHRMVDASGFSSYWFDKFFNNATKYPHPTKGRLTIEQMLKDTDTDLRTINSFKKQIYYKQAARDSVIAGKFKASELDAAGAVVPGTGKKLYTYKTLTWVSLTGKRDYAEYAFFDPAASYASSLITPKIRTYSLKASASFFLTYNKQEVRWNNPKIDFFYVTLGLSRGTSDNLAGMNKKTINTVTTQIIDPVSGAVRQEVDSKTAYDGVYRQFGTTTPSIEVIFAPLKYVALFTNAEVAMIDKGKRDEFDLHSSTLLATGIYFNAGGSSSVNIGVFYKWQQDVTNNKFVGSLNLRTSIPISPL